MRHYHVIGVTAVREHSETFHRAAKILLAAPAGAAAAAPDPRMHKHARTDLDALRIRSSRHHLPDTLMPERHRQFHAPIGETQPFPATQVKPAIGDMQV